MLNPTDFDALAPELLVVDRWFRDAREQHPMRRWEYAMALRAQAVWTEARGNRPSVVYDVGGAGSPFRFMADRYDDAVRVIDPAERPGESYRLEDYVGPGCELGANVFCLSVLEHVNRLDRFLFYLACLVAPGGLLFLTMDACESPRYQPEDTYHFHWMRKRIFSHASISNDVEIPLLTYGFAPFGGRDAGGPYGPQVYDYTFASVALIKGV